MADQLVNRSTDQLINYILSLADNTLLLSQRNSEWCGHGPVLEQDIAITNISLDLLGQARSLYQYAAKLVNASNSSPTGGGWEGAWPGGAGGQATEDTLACLRKERDFKNCLLTELPNGDWGQTILRQCFFSHFQQLLYGQMLQSKDGTLAAIAEKSLKEVTYHVRWSSEWVIRLGDGTDESHDRMVKALEELWPYTGEFFIPVQYETAMAKEGIGVDVAILQQPWLDKIQEILSEAVLPSPTGELVPHQREGREGAWMQTGGKSGRHTEHLGFILAELQYMQRAYPGAEW